MIPPSNLNARVVVPLANLTCCPASELPHAEAKLLRVKEAGSGQGAISKEEGLRSSGGAWRQPEPMGRDLASCLDEPMERMSSDMEKSWPNMVFVFWILDEG